MWPFKIKQHRHHLHTFWERVKPDKTFCEDKRETLVGCWRCCHCKKIIVRLPNFDYKPNEFDYKPKGDWDYDNDSLKCTVPSPSSPSPYPVRNGPVPRPKPVSRDPSPYPVRK